MVKNTWKKVSTMLLPVANIVQTTEEKNPDYEKKIGNTCYQVNYYFNQNSSMTMQEKVMKIMKAELDMEVRNPA